MAYEYLKRGGYFDRCLLFLAHETKGKHSEKVIDQFEEIFRTQYAFTIFMRLGLLPMYNLETKQICRRALQKSEKEIIEKTKQQIMIDFEGDTQEQKLKEIDDVQLSNEAKEKLYTYFDFFCTIWISK